MSIETAIHCVPLIALLFLSLIGNVLAAGCEIMLRADRERILPFEPVGLILTLENRTDAILQKNESRWSSYRIAKARKDGGNLEWRTFMPFGVHMTLPPPTLLALNPGQVIIEFCPIHVGFDGGHVFSEPGTYFVQAGTPFGESNRVAIEVAEPEELLASVVDLLRESRLFMLFDDSSAAYVPTTSGSLETLNHALEELHASPADLPYKPWAVVCEFRLDTIRNNAMSEDQRQRRYGHFFAAADGLPSPQKESLLFSIASAQFADNDFRGAKNTFSRIVLDSKDDFFQGMAKSRLDHFPRIPRTGTVTGSYGDARPSQSP